VTPLLLALQDVVVVPGPELVPPIWRTLGALAIVLALLAALAWLLKRGVIARRGVSGLNVESALPLGERRSLVVVSVEGRRLLLGLGPGHVSLVTELQPPPAPSFERAVADATGAPR
jgi:flagellar biosynthetic protein FliO